MPKMEQWAMVTGASHGLGYAMALFLSRLGYNILGIARRENQLAKLADEISREGHQKCVTFACDIGNLDELVDLIEGVQKGRNISILVHCASTTVDPESDANFLETSFESIAEICDVNISGATILLQKSLLHMSQNDGGNIFIISSDWALRGAHGPSSFAASKAYVAHLAHTLRRQAAKHNVKITTLFPGDIATFDASWEEPKWHLDHDIAAISRELGNERIPIIDICETVEFCINRKLMRVEEVILAPLDPNYDY